MTPETITLANSQLSVEVAMLGAELMRLRDAKGRDFLWDGDATWWASRAPMMFPMAGGALDGRIKVGGQCYPLPQHGFARLSQFEIVEASPTRARLRLRDSDATRAAYPFPFQLDVEFTLAEASLAIVATVSNPGKTELPFSFGYHPAFRWPLPGASGPHVVEFKQKETAPIHKPVVGNLLSRESFANPFADGPVEMAPELFDGGALIFTELKSRHVTFRAGAASVEIAFPEMPYFVLWTKPGAPFLCLEPWQGFGAPEGFDDEFADRPGVVTVAPGASRSFPITIAVNA